MIMSKREEEYLKEQIGEEMNPFFETTDKKVLAIDVFRGPDTGFLSDFDLKNPGNRLFTSEDKWKKI